MTNTEYLYTAIKRFTEVRAAAREAYMQTMKPYESAKGSPFYTEQQKKALKIRNDTVEAAKAECIKKVDNALSLMRRTSNNRPMTAPTEEQLRILQMLKMRKTVTPAELQTAANAMNGNGAALAVIQEIAREQNCATHNFTATSTDGLPASTAEDAIKLLQEVCAGILESGLTRATRLSSEYHTRKYGETVAPDDLPQEKPYSSERDFYERALHWTPYEVFAKSVNE